MDVLPYVSIVLTGRNDGYGGDFNRRFLATLQFNHRELTSREIPHEFVVVEWAPPADAPLLADLVDERCPGSVAAAVRTIVVDAAYHDAITQNPRVKYHEFLAKNVGARRARGTYVITTNIDVFFGRRVLQRLQQRDLAAGVVYRAPRYDLKSTIDSATVGWPILEDAENLAQPGKTLLPPFYGGGTGDFIAVDRASFEAVRGFNEIYRVARIGVDRNFLYQAVSCGLSIVDIGGPVYHVAHEGSFRVTKDEYAGREREAPYGDVRWPASSVTYRNPPGWGLADAPTRVLGARRVCLDFAWSAVPPLVDLVGVTLPALRRKVFGGRVHEPPASEEGSV
jgi:hypothetical protein